MNANALVKKINRAYRSSENEWNKTLRVCPFNSRSFHNLGRYYIADESNVVYEHDVDLDEEVKRLGIRLN